MAASNADFDDCQRFVADQIRFLEQPFEIPDDFYAVDAGIPKRVLDGFARRLNIELRKKGLESFGRQAQHGLFRTLKLIQLAQKPVANVVRVTLPPADPCKQDEWLSTFPAQWPNECTDADPTLIQEYESLWQRVAERQHQLKSTLIKHQHYQELSTAASQLDVAAMQQTIDLRLHNQSQALDDLNRAVLDLGHTVGTRVEPIKTKPIQDPSTLAVNDNTTTSEDAIFDMLGHPDYATSHRR